MRKALKNLIEKARGVVQAWDKEPITYQTIIYAPAVTELQKALEPFDQVDTGVDWYLQYSDTHKKLEQAFKDDVFTAIKELQLSGADTSFTFELWANGIELNASSNGEWHVVKHAGQYSSYEGYTFDNPGDALEKFREMVRDK